MLLAALALTVVLGEGQPTMDCPLAEDIYDATKARMIYLDGEKQRAQDPVEKLLRDYELRGLQGLRHEVAKWLLDNCN